MKKILLLLIVFSTSMFSQDFDEKLNSAIEKLFSTSKLRDFSAVCDLIAYTGSDIERYLTSSLNSTYVDELQQAERIAKKIKAYVDISDSFQITSAEKILEDERELLHAKVEFKSGKQILEVVFKFIEVEDILLLVEID